MGFRFSSFIAGAAERMTETLKEDEKTAAAAASFGVKALKENYDKVQAENRKLESELSENIKFLKTNDPTATESEVFAAATNKAYMAMAVEAAKTNPGSFKIRDTVKIAEENQSPLTAMEQLKAYATIPAVSKAVRIAEGTATPEVSVASTEESGKSPFSLSALRERAGARAGDKAASQTAAAMGIPLEKLKAASGYTRPELDTKAEYDMSGFAKPKSFDQQENDAKAVLLKATKEKDPKRANEARADLMIIQDVKNSLTTSQTAFANKIADIKNRYMFGDAETRKAAKPEYDRLMADIRAEALAKKTGDSDGEGKIPALSTLNTFTSASVARAVAAKHGDLIKTKQLAIVEKADGTVGIDYIGDNDTLRRQILETQASAAKNALSLYTDAQGKPLNRDVASVMNSFTSVVPSVIRTDGGAAPAAAAGPQPAAKPTLPTPTANIRKEAEAAIAAGANRAAVAERFKKQTGQEF